MRLVDYKDENAGPAFDLSGIIMHECLCGSDMWRLVVSFQDYEIATYLLDMECFYCGTRATAPTPIDHPEYEENND